MLMWMQANMRNMRDIMTKAIDNEIGVKIYEKILRYMNYHFSYKNRSTKISIT